MCIIFVRDDYWQRQSGRDKLQPKFKALVIATIQVIEPCSPLDPKVETPYSVFYLASATHNKPGLEVL